MPECEYQLVVYFEKPGHEAWSIVVKDCMLSGVEHGSGRIELCDQP
ncbi:hypothetical protein [Bifidobacterium eulemuris]|nr:hypothetical protein [Bifidobacterium eulemuris]